MLSQHLHQAEKNGGEKKKSIPCELASYSDTWQTAATHTTGEGPLKEV